MLQAIRFSLGQQMMMGKVLEQEKTEKKGKEVRKDGGGIFID